MEAAGISVGSAQTEAGRGQWEVNLEHSDPLQAADQHLLYKACVKELARQAGLTVTFMAGRLPTISGRPAIFTFRSGRMASRCFRSSQDRRHFH